MLSQARVVLAHRHFFGLLGRIFSGNVKAASAFLADKAHSDAGGFRHNNISSDCKITIRQKFDTPTAERSHAREKTLSCHARKNNRENNPCFIGETLLGFVGCLMISFASLLDLLCR